jgi:hypothetical protein
MVVYFGVSIYVFKWYLGISIVFATLFIAIPLASKLLMFPVNSIFIVTKIKNNLIKRKQSYEENGDSEKAEAVSTVLERMEKITNTSHQ